MKSLKRLLVKRVLGENRDGIDLSWMEFRVNRWMQFARTFRDGIIVLKQMKVPTVPTNGTRKALVLITKSHNRRKRHGERESARDARVYVL